MLDKKEEKKAKELRRLASLLHIPVPEAFWTLEVFDKDGKLLQRHHQRSHSWTRNAYNGLFSVMAGKDMNDAALFQGGKLNMKATNGTVYNNPNPWSFSTWSVDGTIHGYRAIAANDDWGILVGSGVNAETFEDYELQTKILEGAGAGQLNHATSEVHDISYAALVFKNELVRYFNNNSGGDIAINEVALVSKPYFPNTEPMVFSRDHLASTITVPDTGQVKVTYTVQLTYPA